MGNEIISDLLPEVPYEPPELDVKRQKLIECVLTRNSKQYLGKAYTKNKITGLVLKKWISSLAMVKSLGKSIIKMY